MAISYGYGQNANYRNTESVLLARQKHIRFRKAILHKTYSGSGALLWTLLGERTTFP